MKISLSLVAALVVLLVVVAVGQPSSVSAANFTVTKTADTAGNCKVHNCSLREGPSLQQGRSPDRQ